MPDSLLDSIQANKLLSKAMNCRSLSLASRTSCIFAAAVKPNYTMHGHDLVAQ